ncbi:hypothetical protein DSUL_50035 [Desulfovibrionales bacterium]
MIRLLKSRRILEWTVFGCLLLISVVGVCSVPEVASYFFPKLFWGKQIGEADRSIIAITMGRDRSEYTLAFMQKIKDGHIRYKNFPYMTADGLEAAIRRTVAKLQRISELDALYREKHERLKRLERQMLGNTFAQNKKGWP